MICLNLLVPILDPSNDQRVTGVILLSIDPYQFLYPLIQTWPTPSRTAETALLHREGNEVVYLNELRHQKATALSLRLPFDSSDACAAIVARGRRGIITGKDYRGEWVLATCDHVPDSPGFLLAKVDESEIFAPIAESARNTIALLVAIVLSAGLGLAYVWRNQEVAFYRDNLILAQRNTYLVKYPNDIFLLADHDLRLLEVNDRAVESYGHVRDELLQMSFQDLYPPETRPLLEEKLQQIEESRGLMFETSQQRKDGAIFPVEIGLTLLELEGHKVYQAIIRDVTWRKQTEESLHSLTEQLMSAQETERQRISLVLHDDLGQALILFKFQLSSLKDILRKEKSPSANDCLGLLQYLDGLINKVRELSREQNPPSILEEMGFQGALRYLIEQIGNVFHIQSFEAAVDQIEPLFSQEALLNIYRIFQECLMNIGRHANASRISINVKKQEEQVSFMIQDNGQGFGTEQIMDQKRGKAGLGIPSIKERVRILGGSINIWSKKGEGTRVSFIVPIKRK